MSTRTRLAATLGILALGWPGGARADEVDALRAEVEQSIAEGHTDQIDDHIELALRKASMANAPVRLGRLELFAAELEADKPTSKIAERARKAMLHLGDDPLAPMAELRWHVSGAQAAFALGRLGGAALHLQQGRAALLRLGGPASTKGAAVGAATGAKLPLGTTNPPRDRVRLDDLERALLARLRAVAQERGGDTAGLPAGHVAAFAAIANGETLRPDPSGNEPLPPRVRSSGEGLLGKLDRALSGAEEREIAEADARADGKLAASARARHAETLLRLGRVAEAVAVRREALAWYRDNGTLDQVVAEARWIADRAEKTPKAAFAARRESVRELQRGLQKLVGPQRAAAEARHRGEVAALVEAAAALSAQPGWRGGIELIEAVDLVRDRSVWDHVALFADGARWRRLGGGAAEVQRMLEAIARDDVGHGLDALSLVDNLASPASRARQKASEAMARADAPAADPAPIDGAAVAARLGSRTLVVYGRLDGARVAIGVLPAGGAARVVVGRLALDEELRLSGALRRGLRENGDAWHEPAQKLHAALIAPVEAQLGDAAVIIPDGPMVAVPLAALENGSGELLAEKVVVTMAPSLVALSAPRSEQLPSRAALLLGVPRFAEPGALPLTAIERGLAGLKAVLSSAGRTARVLPVATSVAQLLGESGQLDVAHVMSRLRLDGEMPVVGALLLGTGPLFAYDLSRMALRANLLILDTPATTKEAAPLALSRGLAGIIGGALSRPARSLLVAVQGTEGPAGAALFSRCYERYAAGESPSVALANAQRDMASGRLEQPLLLAVGADPITDGNRFVHPRYWAGYAAWGEP